jgi:leucyl-tRNA synthetase
MKDYNFGEIEEKWSKIWEEQKYGKSEDFSDKPKYYSLLEFPYPSGAGLHVGHCLMYSAADTHARMMRMKGYNVLFPMGWDAFGLPTENYAIKMKIKPQDATAVNIKTFKRQQKSMGYCFDWDREISTTDPEFYKWTQWIFLQFYKHGVVDPEKSQGSSGHGGKLIEIADDDKTTPRMAFQAKMPVNWCPSCRTILANEEVIAGKCERCGAQSEKRVQTQWMLRITAYADKLIDGLSTVNYEEKIKTQQINWIGKSIGSNIKFDLKTKNYPLKTSVEVFTTRADTLFGCTYVVIAPENPLVEALRADISNWEDVSKYVTSAKKKSDLERTELQKDKTGVKLEGVTAINPINGREVDIFIADYVLATYGTGSVMAVPAHDERDFEFANKYDIEIIQSIAPVAVSVIPASSSVISASSSVIPAKAGIQAESLEKAFTSYGVLVNSAEFTSMTSEEGKKAITEKLKKEGKGDFTVNFKLRDWIFSRQHYWGEPIPIIHCDKCGTLPISEDELPLTLPDVEKYEPTDDGQSPLAAISEWVNVICPKCGGKATRETDTMPNWAGSSWYYLRYMDPKNDNALADPNKLDYWKQVDLYNGGNEHITLHLLYSRFWNIFLHDLGVVPFSEPYAKRINHGMILGPDGQKMSKSKGNVINPDDMVKQYGADTLRTYMMFIGPYDQDSSWSNASIQGVHRFMKRIWKNTDLISDQADAKELLIKLNQTIKGVGEDIEKFQINTIISKLMEMNNMLEHTGHVTLESFAKYLRLLFVTAPFIASEIWETLKIKGNIGDLWPEFDESYLQSDELEIVVQINGKVREKIQVSSSISDDELKKIALENPKIIEFIGENKIIKTIVVPKKLVSIVIAQ